MVKMGLSQRVMVSLIALSSLGGVGCMGEAPTSKVSSLKQQELEAALLFLEGNLSSLGEVGYAEWTPTTAAAELVETMNASMVLLPEEEEDYRQAGIKPKEPIPYVLNQPTAAWQIVLIPDDAQQVIRVEAYGQELETPLIEKDLPCCGF